MSSILAEIDEALAAHDPTLGRPVAIYLGERKLTGRSAATRVYALEP